MAIPKIEYPTHNIFLHSLDRNVKFRPFLVKEEKILLIAKESKDPEEIRNAVIQIIANCTAEPIEIDKLPIFDIEMIFLKLRARSVGESVKLQFHCQNQVSEDSNGDPIFCNSDTDYVLDLEKVKYEIPEGHDNKVMITDKIGVKLKYPTLTSAVKEEKDEIETMINMVADNVEYVFDEESVTKPADMQPNELISFLDTLTVEALERIKMFFATSPKVVLEDHVTCKKCGFEHVMHSEDLLSFFI